MAVSRLLQQSRFHYKRKSSGALFNDGGVGKKGSGLRKKNLFGNDNMWEDKLSMSLQTSLQKVEDNKCFTRHTRQRTSQKNQQDILERKFSYPSSNISPTSITTTTPNVHEDIFFAEDFIDFLCFRQSVGNRGRDGWKVFNKFWSCKKAKMENDTDDLYRITDSVQSPSEYLGNSLDPPYNYQLDNDSADYLSEESLEPTEISSYFV